MDPKILEEARKRIDEVGGGPPEDGVYAVPGYDHDGRKLDFNGDPHDCPTGSCSQCDITCDDSEPGEDSAPKST